MITIYHGSNVRIADIDLKQCNPYKDFGQAFYLTTCEQCGFSMAGEMDAVFHFCPETILAGLDLRVDK